MKLAIIDPDPTDADVLSFVAQRRGHQPLAVSAVSRLEERLPFTPAAAVLATGFIDEPTLRDIGAVRKRFPEAHILVLCERPGHDGALAALKAGANDLVRSPCHPVELVQRLERNAAPPGRPAPSPGVRRFADIEVDLDAHTATKAGMDLGLTKLERRLLFCLLEHHPNVATLDRLLTFGWDALEEPEASLLKTHVSHIRRKLKAAGGAALEIVSHQTIGYSIREVEQAEAM